MKLSAVAAPIAFALGAAVGFGARPSLALARGEKVVLENEKVRVVEFVLEPGVAMGMHDHPRDRVEITIAGGKVRVTGADGKTQEVDEKEGSVEFNKASASRHDVTNIGARALRAYHVELKP